MPGVTNGYPGSQWDDRASGFDYPPPSRSEMSPNRREESPRHSYSNGYNSDQQSDSNDEGPTYLLEHLATFTVGPPTGIQQPSDGLRRLLQMEKTSGIWTQKMQLRLEKKWIVIIDFENGDVVERFPVSLISDATAFTNTELKDLYNNVLVFIVREDPRKKNVNPAEMHIFQCVRISAQEVAEDMKLFMAGKWKLGFGKSDGRHIPPPPNNPPPEPPVNGVNVRQHVSRFNAVTSSTSQRNEMHASHASQPSPLSHSSHLGASRSGYRESADETSSTSSEKYERDVTVLNCCFDDIERFIGRLQSAAAAYRELERRRRTRKGKKKDHGEGMLSMRAKPPPEQEFVDILQKFKLSFNLLAKLKSHIHDPNAPELVHFLFTPLALIMDASRDSNYGPNLAAKVVSPLLTRDAIDLLINCLTSKESDLWHSLGDAWTVPREQWKDYVSPYHPVFSNGWAPDYPFSEDRERAELTAAAAASAAQRARRDEILKAQHDAEVREQEYQRVTGSHTDGRYGNNFYYSSDRGDRPSPLPSVEDRRQQFETPPFDGHIDDRRGFGERERARSPQSDRDYPDHRERDGRSDISADSIERGPLDPQRHFDRHQRQWLEELKHRGARIVQVTYPRTANNDKEMTVFRGEYLEVLDDTRKWWKTRNIRNQVAHVPHTIVTPYQPGDEDAIFSNPLYARGGRDPYFGQDSPNRSTDGSFSGDRPMPRGPPVPPPAPAPAEWIRKERQGKKAVSADSPVYVRVFPLENGHCDSLYTPNSNGVRFDLNGHNLSPSPASSNDVNHRQQLSPTTKAPPAPPPPGPTVVRSYVPISPPAPEPKYLPLIPPSPEHRKFNPRVMALPNNKDVSVQQNQEHVNRELRSRLTSFNLKDFQRPSFPRPKAPDAFIDDRSTSGEVLSWLKAKEFRPRTIDLLQGIDGVTILSLDHEELEQHLDHDEVVRLKSQLNIQKSVCGFKTTRTKELTDILKRHRHRAEHAPLSPSNASDSSASIPVEDYDDYGFEDDHHPAEKAYSSGNEGGTLRNALLQQKSRMFGDRYQRELDEVFA